MTEVTVKQDNGLYYENYVQREVPSEDLVADFDAEIRRLEEHPDGNTTRHEALKNAGLRTLAQNYTRTHPSRLKELKRQRPLRMLGLVPMTKEEREVWEQWLPTCYVGNLSGEYVSRRDRPWARDHNPLELYDYSDVPLEVAQTLANRAQDFDFVYIRTPENRYERARRRPTVDPILVGVKGDDHWLLARWGEVDPREVSFEKLREAAGLERWTRKTYNRRQRDTLGESLLAGIVGALGGGVVLGMLGVGLLGHTALGWVSSETAWQLVLGLTVFGVLAPQPVVWWNWLGRTIGRAVARVKYPGVEKLL